MSSLQDEAGAVKARASRLAAPPAHARRHLQSLVLSDCTVVVGADEFSYLTSLAETSSDSALARDAVNASAPPLSSATQAASVSPALGRKVLAAPGSSYNASVEPALLLGVTLVK
jgi:hypothetical protein